VGARRGTPEKSTGGAAGAAELAVAGEDPVSAGDGVPDLAGTSTTDDNQPPPIAARDAAKGATMGKPADTKTTTTKSAGAAEAKATRVAPKTTRTAAETEKIRVALAARREELQVEYESTISEITELQRDRLTDSAGDDQADTGTKTFEREQEISLANNILERITQVERAIERLSDGSYGWCERCGNPIPVERLAAFPSATLCVTCKALEERR
jgi:RNA polymerase-binding protein DksA